MKRYLKALKARFMYHLRQWIGVNITFTDTDESQFLMNDALNAVGYALQELERIRNQLFELRDRKVDGE